MSGFYVMHRGWMDSFKPEPFTEREAFLWLWIGVEKGPR